MAFKTPLHERERNRIRSRAWREREKKKKLAAEQAQQAPSITATTQKPRTAAAAAAVDRELRHKISRALTPEPPEPREPKQRGKPRYGRLTARFLSSGWNKLPAAPRDERASWNPRRFSED